MRRRILLAVAVIFFSTAAAVAAAPTKTKPVPPFSEIKQATLRYFQAIPDYRSGDLITQDKVGPLLAKLQQMGLPLPNAKQILAKVPTKGEFLAEQFSSPEGRIFMRQISGLKDGYDRLDRLSRMPRGEQTIRDLIRGPDGYKMVEYMTTAPGGKVLGEQLSNAPTGEGFNAPTGRIYTAKMLLRRLEQCHADALKAAKR
jgi:hypothetical protein